MAREPLRVWSGSRDDTINVGILIYGDRLPAGDSPEAISRRLIEKIEELLNQHFGTYSYTISPAARRRLQGQ